MENLRNNGALKWILVIAALAAAWGSLTYACNNNTRRLNNLESKHSEMLKVLVEIKADVKWLIGKKHSLP